MLDAAMIESIWIPTSPVAFIAKAALEVEP
jgi:hypothetical protein